MHDPVVTMRGIVQVTYADHGALVGAVRSNSQGLLWGALRVLNVPLEMPARELFARTMTRRFSINPGNLLDGGVFGPRDAAMEVLGAEEAATLVFVMVNVPVLDEDRFRTVESVLAYSSQHKLAAYRPRRSINGSRTRVRKPVRRMSSGFHVELGDYPMSKPRAAAPIPFRYSPDPTPRKRA